MKISALTDVVEGELLNSPAISFITQIHTNIKKVNDGDAFFAKNTQEVTQAINKGAFAIILDFETLIIDNEIAWIQVDDLTKAITNILRYKQLENNHSYFYIDKVLFTYLKVFKTKDMNNIILLSQDIYGEFEILYNLDPNKIIYSTDVNLLKSINPNIKTIEYKVYDIKNLTNHSLFETSFSYRDRFYDRLKIPHVYIDHFLILIDILNYKIDTRKLNNFPYFRPIFINKGNIAVNFGQTGRFILASTDIEIANIEIAYIETFYSYAHIKIIDAQDMDDNELFFHIQDDRYNALYCKGKDISHINNILEQNNKIDQLF